VNSANTTHQRRRMACLCITCKKPVTESFLRCPECRDRMNAARRRKAKAVSDEK